MSKISVWTMICSAICAFNCLTANLLTDPLCEKGIFPEPGGTPKEAIVPEWIESNDPQAPTPTPQPAPPPENPKAKKDIFPQPVVE